MLHGFLQALARPYANHCAEECKPLCRQWHSRTGKSVLFVNAFQVGATVVVEQNLVILVTFLAHYGGTYLAQSYAVSPSCAGDDEPLRHTIADIFLIHNECATLQV